MVNSLGPKMMKELIGKTIDKITVSNDQTILAFHCDDDSVIAYKTDADCCSYTWFADIVGIKDTLKRFATRWSRERVIKDVVESDMHWYNVNDGRTRQEYDQAYGYTLYHYCGCLKIAFRNSSNGYYGGSIFLYEGELPENMIEITDDWSA